MTEETFRKAKDPDDLDPDAPTPEDAEAEREGKKWGALARSKGLNHDMLLRTEHTETEYVWIVDRTRAEPVPAEAP